jgi:diadenosine tetraphosphate (Ap4A) HIT family hydrolase
MLPCKTCELLARRDAGQAPLWDAIWRTPLWDVVHSYNTALAGWMVLIVRRHVGAIDELTEDEAVAVGRLIRYVSLALKQVVGCKKTYVMQFAEHPDHPHVHFHVVPRLADLPPERRGNGIFHYLGVAEAARVSESQMNQIAVEMQRVLPLYEDALF